MGPRRENRDDFLTCHTCKAIFCESGEFHQSHCDSIRNRHFDSDIGNNDFSFQQSYIYDKVLYGTVHELKEPLKNNLNYKKSVLMHTSTMKLCNISIFGYAIVQSYDSQNLYIVLPSTKISKTAIAFANLQQKQYKLKEKVKVFPYFGKVHNAKMVLLSFVSGEKFYGADFLKFLFQDLWNTHIYPGMVIHGVYEGSAFQLIVKNITPKNISTSQSLDESRSIAASEHSLLTATFSKLSLNVSKSQDDTKFYSALESSAIEASQVDGPDSTPAHSKCIDSSNSSLSFQSFESSTLNFKRNFFIHEDVDEYFAFTSTTVIQIESDEEMTIFSQENIKKTFKSIKGLEKQQKIVKEYLDLFFEATSTLDLPNGMLFYGPSGTGKTYLAEAIASTFKVNFVKVAATDVYMKNHFNSENQLKYSFKEAIEKCPCIIFIDELDLLCDMFPNDKNGIISTLGQLIDNVSVTEAAVFVLGAVTDINAVDQSLRKAGRFEVEVKFGIPEVKDRREILLACLNNRNHDLTEKQIDCIAEQTHGFTGFNVVQMFDAESESFQSYESQHCDVSKPCTCFNDLEGKVKQIKPHVLKDDQYSFQKVFWDDIGGMEDVKTKLRHVVQFPLLFPEVFKRFDMSPSRGILMYGPPGCSKTMIAKALATESGLNFIPVKGAEMFSKWVGDSEKAVRDLFKRAKEAAPCIIFFDEIDSLVSDRGSSGGSDVDKRVVTQLLTEVDGAEQLEGVIVVAATNRPDRLDPGTSPTVSSGFRQEWYRWKALAMRIKKSIGTTRSNPTIQEIQAMLRPGRLDHLVYIPLPDANTRKAIFNLKFKTMPVDDDVDVKKLVPKTNGYSGAEVVAVCNEAGFLALSEDFPEIVRNPIIKNHHFDEALKIIRPRISSDVVQFYETFMSSSTMS